MVTDADPGRLQDYLRATARDDRTTHRVGPFTLFVHPWEPTRHVNYAIPDNGAVPTTAEITELRRLCAELDRTLQIQSVDEASPQLGPALAAHGMVGDSAPLMACSAPDLAEPQNDTAAAIRELGDRDLSAVVRVVREAFADPELPADPAYYDPRLRGGGAVVALVDDQIVGTAAWFCVLDGIAEVGSVATSPRYRRRGIGALTTRAAARAAFAAGADRCVLYPEDDGSQAIYARAGFRAVATLTTWTDASREP